MTLTHDRARIERFVTETGTTLVRHVGKRVDEGLQANDDLFTGVALL